MNNADKPAFGAVLSATMQTFNIDVTPAVFDIWWNVLAKYELSSVRRALSDHIQESAWAPKPADIIGRLKPKGAAYQSVPQLEHKRTVDAATLQRIAPTLRARVGGPYWAPDKVRNQQQVDFIRLQADHFGLLSAAERFLRDCQVVGIITHDYRLGTLNMRQPGEDEIEHEEAA